MRHVKTIKHLIWYALISQVFAFYFIGAYQSYQWAKVNLIFERASTVEYATLSEWITKMEDLEAKVAVFNERLTEVFGLPGVPPKDTFDKTVPTKSKR